MELVDHKIMEWNIKYGVFSQMQLKVHKRIKENKRHIILLLYNLPFACILS